MNVITGKHLSRRTFLRGAGATVGLPLLNAMIPAGRWTGALADLSPTRLIAIEIVHGAAGCCDWGESQNLWAPAQVGRDFELSAPNALASVKQFKPHMTIVSNTDVRMAEAFDPKEIGGDHFRSTATFLTQAHTKQTESSDVYAGTSLDQIYAHKFGQATPIPSVQLCIENVDQAGGCGYGYGCAYTDSLSWASPTEPLPMIRDPRVAFDLLFGAGGSSAERTERRKTEKSILDWIVSDVTKLKTTLDAEDRARMDRFTDNIREIERRIQGVEARNASGGERALPAAPLGVPDSFGEHVNLMYDLQALAFQTDSTRVFAFKLSRDATGRVYPESGTNTPFHPGSHHGEKPEAILDFNKINTYHVGTVGYLLDKLQKATEGDKTLLDKSMVVYGSPMGDANLHNHRRCPLVVFGHADGRLEGGVHLKAPDGTPMANALLSLMHRLGMDDLTSFGDSTGEFSLSVPSRSATQSA